MSNATVGANARSLPFDRRAVLRSIATGAVAAVPAVSGAALLAIAPPTLSAAALEVAAPSAGAFDLAGTLARWRETCAKVGAALDRVCAINVPRPTMPEALRARADDPHEIRNWRRMEHHDDGNSSFASEYGSEAAAEIHRWEEEGLMYWRERAPGDDPSPYVIKARRRAEEILTAFNAWEDERAEAHRASGIDEAEAAVSAAIHAQCDVEEAALRAPASAEAIALKLQIFAGRWKEDHDGDETAGINEFGDTESPAVYQAVAIALDLLTLARGAGEAFAPLAAIASAIAARLEGQGIPA